RRTRRHAPCADRRRQKLQAHAGAAVLEDPVSSRPALDLCRRAPRADFRADQRGRRRVPDQFRRTRPADQRSCRALRSRRHLCGDLLGHSGELPVLHGDGKGRAMAETGRLRASAPPVPWFDPVTLVRILILLAVLVIWELVAASGWLYRDVVPSLLAIGQALIKTIVSPDYYYHLGVTAGEVGTALIIGGLSGLVVGIALGANRFLSQAFES